MAIQKKTEKKYKYKVTGKGAQNIDLLADLGWRLIAVDQNSLYFEMEI